MILRPASPVGWKPHPGSQTRFPLAAATAGTTSFTLGKQNAAAARFLPARLFSPVYRHGTVVDAASRERIKRLVTARAGVAL